MNTEVIKEIANQLGIAVSTVTKDVIPAYASYMIAVYASRVIILAIVIPWIFSPYGAFINLLMPH